ncbi:MAG: hypothetical protein CMP84_15865 [Gammaproteobacteria bacterium]|nr:hypothetical protein [Gammaproteobacteria bacterium]|tara:strand:- start:21182 stop:22450 length:1269 start_codon:yes stop_codon:yes gene_type:complete
MADNLSLLGGRMPTQQQGPKLSTVLQGLQAAYTGQGPQFQQQMRAEEQYQRQSAMQDFQMQETLAKSAAQDAVRIRGLLGAGNVNQAIELLRDRAQLENRIGASSDATQNLMQMLMSDPASAIPSLDSAINSAYQIGLIQMPALSETQKLQMQGMQADWNAARNSIVDTMEGNNKLAADAVTGFNKLESLAGFITKAQDKNATDIEKRSGRQAAATILTIMARMASPGVVTDRDFANQAGGQSLQAGVIDYIRNLGQSDPQVASLLASFDPTNPELLDVDALVGQARGLITGQAPSILSTYASQKQRAQAYNPSQNFMSAEFGASSARNIRDLINVSYGDAFDSREFFRNPTSYLERQIQDMPAVGPNTTVPSAAGSIGVLQYESEEEMNAALQSGQITEADVPNIKVKASDGNYYPARFRD